MGRTILFNLFFCSLLVSGSHNCLLCRYIHFETASKNSNEKNILQDRIGNNPVRYKNEEMLIQDIVLHLILIKMYSIADIGQAGQTSVVIHCFSFSSNQGDLLFSIKF